MPNARDIPKSLILTKCSLTNKTLRAARSLFRFLKKKNIKLTLLMKI